MQLQLVNAAPSSCGDGAAHISTPLNTAEKSHEKAGRCATKVAIASRSRCHLNNFKSA
jgi:hypothetical protein